jgi:NTP pyrophosphatase (non-canonical NTP hydrolase)
MNYKEYQKEAARTCANLKSETENNLHMMLGMQTETAELSDVFKKNLAYGKPIDWVNVKEEIGDLMWYIANFCTMNVIDLEQIMQTNIDKLRARFPEKFTQENALSRDLETERKILEK